MCSKKTHPVYKKDDKGAKILKKVSKILLLIDRASDDSLLKMLTSTRWNQFLILLILNFGISW